MVRFKFKAQIKKNSFLNILDYLTDPKPQKQTLQEDEYYFQPFVAPAIKCMEKAAFSGPI